MHRRGLVGFPVTRCLDLVACVQLIVLHREGSPNQSRWMWCCEHLTRQGLWKVGEVLAGTDVGYLGERLVLLQFVYGVRLVNLGLRLLSKVESRLL